MNVEVKVTKDEATPAIAQLRRTLTDGSLETVMGAAVANRVKQHLTGLAGSRHRGAGANFYADAVRSTTFTAKSGEAIVTIAKLGFAQRYYGGTILPIKGKYLTIPAIAEAFGKRAREFSNLRFGFTEGPFGGLVPALVKASASNIKFGRRRKDGTRSVRHVGSVGGEAVFFLAKKVFQRADPSVLPPQAELERVALEAASKRLARLGTRNPEPGTGAPQ